MNLDQIKSPTRALKQIDDLEKQYNDLLDSVVSPLGDGWSVDRKPLFGSTPEQNENIKELLKDKLSEKYPNLTDQQLNNLVRLSFYSAQLSVHGSDEKILASNVALLSFVNSSSVLPRISIPHRRSDSGLVSSVSQEAIDGYKQGIDNLDDYFKDNPLPSNLSPEKLKVVIQDTPEKFARYYKVFSPKGKSEEFIKTRILGFNAIDPSSIAEARNVTDFASLSNTIGLNPQLQGLSTSPATFGGNKYAETITHEFAHTLHRSISLYFGSGGLAGEFEFNKDYRAIKRQFVSEYGKDSFMEHFSEAFSKYVTTGEATPQFKQFLQKYIHSSRSGG